MVNKVSNLKKESENNLMTHEKFKDFIGYRAKETDYKKGFEEPKLSKGRNT